jgi:hypothetical protein
MRFYLGVSLALLALAGCDAGSTGSPAAERPPAAVLPPVPAPVTWDFSFASGQGEWRAGIADYSPGMEGTIGFASGHERLPPLLESRSGMWVSSGNPSSDLFTYIWAPVARLAPSQRYRVDVSLTLAANVPYSCFGIGGSPWGVYVKALASNVEPATILSSGRFVTNFYKGDHGDPNRPWDFAIGDIGHSHAEDGCGQPIFRAKTLSANGNGGVFQTDPAGRLWLVIGTESTWMGTNKIYYLEGTATFTPV